MTTRTNDAYVAESFKCRSYGCTRPRDCDDCGRCGRCGCRCNDDDEPERPMRVWIEGGGTDYPTCPYCGNRNAVFVDDPAWWPNGKCRDCHRMSRRPEAEKGEAT